MLQKVKIFAIALFALLVWACEPNTATNAAQDPNGKSVVIPIEGMSCMACVARVKKTLKDIDGVDRVTVSLQEKNTEIWYNPELVTVAQLQESINEMGYKAGEPEEDKE
jgi:copper chaperone CopZ